jgi:hypothetical protein
MPAMKRGQQIPHNDSRVADQTSRWHVLGLNAVLVPPHGAGQTTRRCSGAVGGAYRSGDSCAVCDSLALGSMRARSAANAGCVQGGGWGWFSCSAYCGTGAVPRRKQLQPQQYQAACADGRGSLADRGVAGEGWVGVAQGAGSAALCYTCAACSAGADAVQRTEQCVVQHPVQYTVQNTVHTAYRVQHPVQCIRQYTVQYSREASGTAGRYTLGTFACQHGGHPKLKVGVPARAAAGEACCCCCCCWGAGCEAASWDNSVASLSCHCCKRQCYL